jgi:iron uptake system component EfeO
MLPARPLLLAALALVIAPVLAGCGPSSNTEATSVAVTATDTTCEVATTTLKAGKVSFGVTNKGSKTTEVYVYGQKDGAFNKIVGEVENIGPSTSRDLVVDLTGGEYELACKPGQVGDGIRQKITVTGAGATSTAEESYDREIELEVTAAGVKGGDNLTAKTGEKIEFKLENKTDGVRHLAIVDPTGKEVAEIETKAATTGETIVALSQAGTWTLKVEGGTADILVKLTVS